MLEAKGYEELAYIAMREANAGPNTYFSASDIISLSEVHKIEINISTKWEVGSESFKKCLASCLRRASAANDIANEELSLIFVSEEKASGGPWKLSVLPKSGEDYFSYRHRVRGTGSNPKTGAANLASGAASLTSDTPSPWLKLGNLLLKVAPGHGFDSSDQTASQPRGVLRP